MSHQEMHCLRSYFVWKFPDSGYYVYATGLLKRVAQRIDHFKVACLVAWPLNESETGGDLVLIETPLLFSC